MTMATTSTPVLLFSTLRFDRPPHPRLLRLMADDNGSPRRKSSPSKRRPHVIPIFGSNLNPAVSSFNFTSDFTPNAGPPDANQPPPPPTTKLTGLGISGTPARPDAQVTPAAELLQPPKSPDVNPTIVKSPPSPRTPRGRLEQQRFGYARDLPPSPHTPSIVNGEQAKDERGMCACARSQTTLLKIRNTRQPQLTSLHLMLKRSSARFTSALLHT